MSNSLDFMTSLAGLSENQLGTGNQVVENQENPHEECFVKSDILHDFVYSYVGGPSIYAERSINEHGCHWQASQIHTLPGGSQPHLLIVSLQ